jgi:hypothetical protein
VFEGLRLKLTDGTILTDSFTIAEIKIIGKSATSNDDLTPGEVVYDDESYICDEGSFV